MYFLNIFCFSISDLVYIFCNVCVFFFIKLKGKKAMPLEFLFIDIHSWILICW